MAHRLSTIKNCDYVYVIADGVVAEEGSFKDLYKRSDSRFRKMCVMQNL